MLHEETTWSIFLFSVQNGDTYHWASWSAQSRKYKKNTDSTVPTYTRDNDDISTKIDNILSKWTRMSSNAHIITETTKGYAKRPATDAAILSSQPKKGNRLWLISTLRNSEY